MYYDICISIALPPVIHLHFYKCTGKAGGCKEHARRQCYDCKDQEGSKLSAHQASEYIFKDGIHSNITSLFLPAAGYISGEFPPIWLSAVQPYNRHFLQQP